MNDTVIDEAMRIGGVRGVAVVGASGKVSAASGAAGELSHFFEMLFAAALPHARDAAALSLRRIVVRTDRDEVFSLLMERAEALGLVSEKWRPVTELCADLEALLARN